MNKIYVRRVPRDFAIRCAANDTAIEDAVLNTPAVWSAIQHG